MDTTETKQCLICNTPKPLGEFSVRKDNGHRRNVCNTCIKIQRDKWKAANAQRRKETQQIYNALPKCKEQRRAYKRYMREHKYNLYLWPSWEAGKRLVRGLSSKNEELPSQGHLRFNGPIKKVVDKNPTIK